MSSPQYCLTPIQYQNYIYDRCRRTKPNGGGATRERKRQFSSYHPVTNAMRIAGIVRLGQGKKVTIPIDVNYLGRIEGQRGGGGTVLRNVF